MKNQIHKVEELSPDFQKYINLFVYHDAYEIAAFNMAKYFTNKEGKILDVGCGGGAQISLLQLYGYHNLYVCDAFIGNYDTHPDPQFWGWGDIKTIRKRFEHQGIKTKKITGKKLPYKDKEFDYVFNTDVIEHLVDPYTFLVENNRILKKGGLIYCQVPNVVSIKNLKLILMGINPYVNFEGWFNKDNVNITTSSWGGHIREISMKELVIMLKQTGFEVIATKYVSYEKKQKVATKIYPPFGFHCTAFARKK